ncbi:MAG: PAS domain S-box protein [Nitrosopumilus sp.]
MRQTEARKTLKDAPVMWRRINSIGIILDCNSTYATNLGYTKSEIIGKSIFEHVPKEEWKTMNDSLKTWFETGKVTNRTITFKKQNGSIFQGLLQATSLYDENKNLLGSNTVIFDLTQLTGTKIKELKEFFIESNKKLEEIREDDYDNLDKSSKSEYDGLKKMFEVLSIVDLHKIANNTSSS